MDKEDVDWQRPRATGGGTVGYEGPKEHLGNSNSKGAIGHDPANRAKRQDALERDAKRYQGLGRETKRPPDWDLPTGVEKSQSPTPRLLEEK